MGVAGAFIWLLLPWFEILTRIRHLEMPINNRLHHRKPPNPAFFPNAVQAAGAMEDAGFEHVSDCGWNWAGMQQHFRLFWHPVEKAVASVCLCEQDDVAFAFISVSSVDTLGNQWRTTNYPFAPTLKCSPNLLWNHVPCERSCFHEILKDHKSFLTRKRVSEESLRVPDPDMIESQIEAEMDAQIHHNLKRGIILLTENQHFRYSTRGLFFLWGQSIKDLIRLC